MRSLEFAFSRLSRDRTTTSTIAGLSSVVTAGAVVAVSTLSGSDASFVVNPFLIPVLLGVLLSIATAAALGRPRVADELSRLGWSRRERVVAFAAERTVAIAVGVIPIWLIAVVFTAGATPVAIWIVIGALVTSVIGEVARTRARVSSSGRSSVWRILGAAALGLVGVSCADGLGTGVTNGSGMGLMIPAAVVMATIGGAAILPFVIAAVPARGWARAALRPLSRDRRRVRAALVVILPCMLLMALMSVFVPSFEAREADRLAARDEFIAEGRAAVRPTEMWVTSGPSALDASLGTGPESPLAAPTPEATAAALEAASEAAMAALPDATMVEIETLAVSPTDVGPWYPTFADPDSSKPSESLGDQLARLYAASRGLDVFAATPELLAALDPTGQLSVPVGGALVFDPRFVDEGTVTLSRSVGGETVTLPAQVVGSESDDRLPAVIADPAALAGFGVSRQPFGFLVVAPTPISEGTAAVVRQAGIIQYDSVAASVAVYDAWTSFDSGPSVFATPQDELPFVPSDLADVWRLMIVGTLIALAAITAIIIGSMLDRGEEYEVLHRAGASQALRRSVAALQAGVVLLVAAVFALGVVAMCTESGFSSYNALEETALPVPWRIDVGIAALVVVGVPLVGAALAAAVTPRRRRAGGVVGGRLRPLRSHG